MRTETILVIPFADGIGDFVNMQPLLAAIRRRFPEAEVSVAVSAHGAALNNDPAIRTLTPGGLDHTPSPWQQKLRWLLPQQVLAWCAGPLFDMQLGPFDLVINLFFAWERAMDFRHIWTPQMPPVPDVLHTVDCLADELERELNLYVPPGERKPVLALRPAAQAAAAHFWADQDLAGDAPVVALVPVSNMLIKRWPADYWLALDRQLRAECPGLRTLLFCDTAVAGNEWAQAFAAAGSPALPVYAPLDEVAALLARCNLVVGGDTGLLHIGAALEVPWVGLFGPTNPAATGPYDTSRGVALVAPFRKPASCAGCWKHFKYEDDRCRTLTVGSCMSKLTPAPVARMALAQLAHPGMPYRPVPLAPAPRLAPAPLPVEFGAGFFQHS